MEYLEEKELKSESYYLVQGYDGDFAVLQCRKGGIGCRWNLDQAWDQIRYVIKEIDMEPLIKI